MSHYSTDCLLVGSAQPVCVGGCVGMDGCVSVCVDGCVYVCVWMGVCVCR